MSFTAPHLPRIYFWACLAFSGLAFVALVVNRRPTKHVKHGIPTFSPWDLDVDTKQFIAQMKNVPSQDDLPWMDGEIRTQPDRRKLTLDVQSDHSRPLTPEKQKCLRVLDKVKRPTVSLATSGEEVKLLPRRISFLHVYPALLQPAFICAWNAALLQTSKRQTMDISVSIYAQNPEDMDTTWSLSHLRNVEIRNAYITSVLKDTPLESWWFKAKLTPMVSNKVVKMMAQKLGIMYRQGGIFMELDVVAVNDLTPLFSDRFLVSQNGVIVDTVFGVEKADEFIEYAMKEFLEIVNSENDPNAGISGIFHRTYEKYCKSSSTPLKSCSTLKILSGDLFLNPSVELLTDPWYTPTACNAYKTILSNAYSISWKRHASMKGDWEKRFEPAEDSLLEYIMQKHCPRWRGFWLKSSVKSSNGNNVNQEAASGEVE